MNLQIADTPERTGYDRDACQIGIVHLGYGAFHRAHQAVYIDDYMDRTRDLRWGIAAVNLRRSESQFFGDSQNARDGYLLKTTSPKGNVRTRLVRSHVLFRDWSADAKSAEELLELPSVHVVSTTVTESGYCLDDKGALNRNDPAIVAETSGAAPTTVYGFLAAALQRRVDATGQPITIICCDNIRANGDKLKKNFIQYLKLSGRTGLATWANDNAAFPNSMVDRITPRSTSSLSDEVARAFPGAHLSPVHAEEFSQWVLEERFAGPMPDLTCAGVEVVNDVDPYEVAKIRILNGGHTGLCYVAALASCQTFDQAMHDPKLRSFFDLWQNENVLPGLSRPLPFDKSAYLESVSERFGNAAIADELSRICMDGWSKMPIFVRPTLEHCLAKGISPTYGYDCVASWYVFARAHRAGKMPVIYREPYWDVLEPLLAVGEETAFANNHALWADLPKTYSEFVPGVVSAIRRMDEKWPV